jgi:outer membrane protein assembly factor BamB
MGRGRVIAGWLPAVLLVPAAAVAGVVATVPEDRLAAMREEQPLDLGTTWVYDVYDHGKPSGTRTSQVVRPATYPGDDGAALPLTEVTRDYTDYPGSGGPRSTRSYMTVRGSSMYQYALEEGDTWYQLDPPLVAYRLPVEEGRSWSYKGMVGDIEYSSETELTEVVDVEVGGHTFEGCAHFVTVVPLDLDDSDKLDPDATETVDEWTCPGYGTVKARDRVDTTDVDITEELTEFHGVEANWYAEGHEPDPVAHADVVPGSTFGFGSGRTFAVPEGTLGRALAWSDMWSERALHPPASDGEVMVYAERDGAVSLRTAGTGEMRWQLRLRGPILAAPVIAGDAVIVADSLKHVWALSRDDGRALWVRTLPDVVSASPVVAGDHVAVPTDDGSLTMLALVDGETRWQQELGGAVRNAVAYDGEHLLTADGSGSLAALDPDDGDVAWSTSLDAGISQGPVVTDGRIIVLDREGGLHAFSPAGHIEWQSRRRAYASTPLAAGNGVVALADAGGVTAYDTDDGRLLWARDLPDQTGHPTVVGDELVVGLADGEVRVYGLTGGRLVDHWTLPPAEPGGTWTDSVEPALVGDDLVLVAFGRGQTGTVLFAYPTTREAPHGVRLRLSHRTFLESPAEPPVLVGDDLVMAAFDQLLRIRPDGSHVVLAETPDSTHSGAVVADGIVVTRDEDSVQGLRLEDGKVLWEAPGGAPSLGSVPATDGTSVFYGIEGLGLASADLHTGQLRWATPVPGQHTQMTPLVLPEGDVVYGGGGIGRYDGDTGQEEWRVPDAVVFGPMAYAGGVVYALTVSTSGGAAITGYDAGTGKPLWTHPVSDAAPFVGPGVGNGVVVSLDGHVAHAYDAATGAELWSLGMRRAPFASPVVTDGHVFLVQSGNGRNVEDDEYRVSVHDPRTGRLLAAWQPGNALIGQGRPMVAGTTDGRLLVPELGLTIVEAVG